MEYNDDMLLFADMVNRHHEEVVEENKRKSLSQEKVNYVKKKRVSPKQIRRALVALALVSTLTFGGIKVANALETAEVNQRIQYYHSIMDSVRSREENDHSIETYEGHNYANGSDPLVSYQYWNKDNLVKHVVEASKAKNPGVEVRCALIAAYNVINEPYREEQFEILFNRIKNNEEFINNTGFDVSKGSIPEMLGYKDFDDFKNNIRKDTKDLYLEGKSGKHGKGL